MQVTVTHKFIHEAPRKLRLVSDSVRGLPAEVAAAELATISQKASVTVRKAILSGIAAAKQQGMNENSLFIGSIMVDEGPKMRRIIMLGRGRSQRIQKRMCHLHVTISDEPKKIASGRATNKELGIAKKTVKAVTEGSK
jgi:large subunit ribosomal protein L22